MTVDDIFDVLPGMGGVIGMGVFPGIGNEGIGAITGDVGGSSGGSLNGFVRSFLGVGSGGSSTLVTLMEPSLLVKLSRIG